MAAGLGAVGRTVTFPVAHGLLTHALALGLGVRALRVAERILTYGITLGASSDLAMLHRASNFALGFVALNLTLALTLALARSLKLALTLILTLVLTLIPLLVLILITYSLYVRCKYKST